MPRKKKSENGLGVRIGQNIKSARVGRGLTQAKLAEIIGVEVETISRIETGVQLPSLERLDEIAKTLSQSLATLVAEGRYADQQIAESLAELPKRERDFLCAFISDYVRHWQSSAKDKKR